MSYTSRLCRPVFVFLILSIIEDVNGVITIPPLNTVAEVGQQAIFNCTSLTTVQHWALTTKREDLATGAAVDIAVNCVVQNGSATHYEVDRPGGSNNICNLIVKDVTMQQAGIYTCSDTATGPSAILTILDLSINITYTNTRDVMEGENVVITCSLNYTAPVEPSATLRPHFYWTDYTGNNVSSSYDSTPVNGPAISQIMRTAGRQDITPFTCHVYLQLISSATPGYANNIPSVNSSASSPTIAVFYAPSIPVITSTYQILQIHGIACEVGVLTCSSNGNPPPTYEWFDTSGNNKISNEMTFDLAEINRNYTCLVKNTIRSVVYDEVSFRVQTSQTNVQDCDFPRNESTSIIATGCEDTSSCVCSHGAGGLALVCNAVTFPNALYIWKGADGNVVYSPVNIDISSNGAYHCAAYFDRLLSNYTGNGIYPNGSREKIVTECSISITASPTPTMESTTSTSNACAYQPVACSSDDVAIAMGVLFGISLAVNVTILIIWIYKCLRTKQDSSKKPENVHRPDMVAISNVTAAPSAYEELRLPDESQLNTDNYQQLRLRPTSN